MVAELLKTGKHSVTAITRKDSTANFPSGVNVARVDYSSQDSLVSALKSHDFLIITLGVRVPEETHSNIVKAAATAGIPYVMPNVYGYDILNEKLYGESVYGAASFRSINDVKNAGLNYMVMCCGFWYEWSLALGEPWYGFNIKDKKVVFFDDGTTKINTSTLEQCGKAVAALLSFPITSEGSGKPALEDWKNKPLYISSFLINQRDMLDSLHRVMGTKDEEWSIEYQPSEQRYKTAVEDMQKGNMLGYVRSLYSRVFYPTGDGNFEANRGLANEVLGLEKEDLDKVTKWVVDKIEEHGGSPFSVNML